MTTKETPFWDSLNLAREVDCHLKPGTHGSTLKIDGVDISRIRRIEIVHEAGEPPKVVIELLVRDAVRVTGGALVEPVFFAFDANSEEMIELVPKK